jgi:FkbM family methyltransferase
MTTTSGDAPTSVELGEEVERAAALLCGSLAASDSGTAPLVSLRDGFVRVLRSRLARHGIVIGRMPSTNRLDHALVRVLSERKVDHVLDVGAHTGGFGRVLRDLCGWRGPICSFEPVHSSFVELERAMEHDPTWHGHEMALGSAPATAVMRHFPAHSIFDSLLPASAYGRRRFAELASTSTEEPVTVQRLDAVIDEVLLFGPNERLLLKTDTQGFDLEVVRGASNCLDRIVAIQIELPAIAIYDGLPPLGVAIDEIMGLGFYPVGFFPITRDRTLRVVEFDGLFVRAP